MHPLIDFSGLTVQELMDKQQEYTKKLYRIQPNSPLYDNVIAMKEAVEQEYQERMYMQMFKEKKEEIEEVIDIGNIESTVETPDYRDTKEQLVHKLAMHYSKKDTDSQ